MEKVVGLQCRGAKTTQDGGGQVQHWAVVHPAVSESSHLSKIVRWYLFSQRVGWRDGAGWGEIV